MTRIMGDSINFAAIPQDVSIVSYYTDGHLGVEAPAAVQARFPHTRYGWNSIDVNGSTPQASTRDWETGDKAGSLQQWCIDHNQAVGKKDAVVYCNISTIPEVRQLTGNQILGTDYWLWIATLDGKLVTPGPVHLDSPPYTYPHVIANQVFGSALTGGDWDMSLVFDPAFFLPLPPPKPPVSAAQAKAAVAAIEQGLAGTVVNMATLTAYIAQG